MLVEITLSRLHKLKIYCRESVPALLIEQTATLGLDSSKVDAGRQHAREGLVVRVVPKHDRQHVDDQVGEPWVREMRTCVCRSRRWETRRSRLQAEPLEETRRLRRRLRASMHDVIMCNSVPENSEG